MSSVLDDILGRASSRRAPQSTAQPKPSAPEWLHNPSTPPAPAPSTSAGASPSIAPVAPLPPIAGQAKAPTAEEAAQSVGQMMHPAPRRMSYTDMFEAMHPNKPLSADEKAKEEGRARWRKFSAALSDGLGAIANLYYTSQGAPSSFSPALLEGSKEAERYKMMKERWKAEEAAYAQGRMQAAMADYRADQERRAAEASAAASAYERQRKDAKDAFDRSIAIAGVRHKDAQLAGDMAYKQQQIGLRQQELKQQAARDADASRRGWAHFGLAQQRAGGTGSTKDVYEIDLGKGDEGGIIKIPKSRINEANIGKLYRLVSKDNKIPEVMGMNGMSKPSRDQMLQAIGADVKSNPELKTALDRLAGNNRSFIIKERGGRKQEPQQAKTINPNAGITPQAPVKRHLDNPY